MVCRGILLEIRRRGDRVADATGTTGSPRSSGKGGRLERKTSKPIMITLYIKTHRITGLKYFGKTMKENPISYAGSGKYWLLHLRKHGHNFKTEIVGRYENVEEATKIALAFSKYNNIVESDEWANLIEENALDGRSKGFTLSEETREKMSKKKKGISRGPHTQERRENIRKAKLGVPNLKLKGISKSKEHIEKCTLSLSKEWILTDPEGNERNIINLRRFCRENNLDQRSMMRVVKGEYRHHKGWKCRRMS